MPAKTKKKVTKSQPAIKRKPALPKTNPVRSFHVSYLALAIGGLMLIEGLLLNCSSVAAWQDATTVMDMSPAVTQTVEDLKITLEPVAETISTVNQFYSLSADAAMELLDFSGSENTLLEVYNGVSQFYILASVEMETLLTFDSLAINLAQAAGLTQ